MIYKEWCLQRNYPYLMKISVVINKLGLDAVPSFFKYIITIIKYLLRAFLFFRWTALKNLQNFVIFLISFKHALSIVDCR
jgi:hypothetical protein